MGMYIRLNMHLKPNKSKFLKFKDGNRRSYTSVTLPEVTSNVYPEESKIRLSSQVLADSTAASMANESCSTYYKLLTYPSVFPILCIILQHSQ